jgi:large subunit ribosomal protein L18
MRKSLAKIKNPKKAKEYRRCLSIRKKVIGSAEIPRLCATKTNASLRIQAIDDAKSTTLFSVETFGKKKVASGSNSEAAKVVGKTVADKLKKAGITKAVFDRSGKQYIGVLKVLADAVRENGIQM